MPAELARNGCIHEVLCNLSLCGLVHPCNSSCHGQCWLVIDGDTCNRKLCVFVRTGSTSIPNKHPWSVTNPGDKQVGAARHTEAVNPFKTTSAVAPQTRRERAPQHDKEVVLAGSPRAFRPRRLDSCRCHLPGPRLVGFRPTAAMPAVFSGGSEFATTATPNCHTGDECIQHCRALRGRRHTTKTHAKKVWSNASALVTDIAPTAVLSCTKQNTIPTINSVPFGHTLTNLGPAAFGAGGASHACGFHTGGGGQSKIMSHWFASTGFTGAGAASTGFTGAGGKTVASPLSASTGFTGAGAKSDGASRGFTLAGTTVASPLDASTGFTGAGATGDGACRGSTRAGTDCDLNQATSFLTQRSIAANNSACGSNAGRSSFLASTGIARCIWSFFSDSPETPEFRASLEKRHQYLMAYAHQMSTHKASDIKHHTCHVAAGGHEAASPLCPTLRGGRIHRQREQQMATTTTKRTVAVTTAGSTTTVTAAASATLLTTTSTTSPTPSPPRVGMLQTQPRCTTHQS